jgi:ABC-type uncharacterized transport system substrate-binding protein
VLEYLKYTSLFFIMMPALAEAHPHVWVSMRSDVVFTADGKIEGIDVEWTFDDAYAAEALDGMDANGDGEYSQAELEPLTKENLSSLNDYKYFTFMKAGGKLLDTAPPTNAGQTYNGKKLQLHFEIPLLVPYDPHKGDFSVKIYDPEFFIAFDYAKEAPVNMQDGMPQGCAFTLKPVPTDAELNTTLAMLATKDRTWKPENGEDFGALFAQPVIISCAS